MTETASAHVQVLPADLSGYVTREEMAAHLAPMRDDIAEIKGDVKALLRSDAGSSALSGFFRHTTMLIATVASGLIGATAALFLH